MSVRLGHVELTGDTSNLDERGGAQRLWTQTQLDGVIEHLQEAEIVVEQGPVRRTGARGPIISVYLRDPDGNLIEISNYQQAP